MNVIIDREFKKYVVEVKYMSDRITFIIFDDVLNIVSGYVL